MPDRGPSEARTRLDFQVGEFRILINLLRGKVVVSRAAREDLAHLTLSWRNQSGEVDLHLTREHERAMRTGHWTEDYEPLFRLTRSKVDELGMGVGEVAKHFILEGLRKRWRKFRPGWLAKNGFLLLQIERGAFDRAVETLSPRRRGKYRVDFTVLESGTWVAEQDVTFYDPRALHDLGHTEREQPVQVARIHGGRTERILLRHGRGPDGTLGWWGVIDHEAMGAYNTLHERLVEWARPLVTSEHAQKFEQVVRGLALEDSAVGRNFSASVRRFLRDATRSEPGPDQRAGRTDGDAAAAIGSRSD